MPKYKFVFPFLFEKEIPSLHTCFHIILFVKEKYSLQPLELDDSEYLEQAFITECTS